MMVCLEKHSGNLWESHGKDTVDTKKYLQYCLPNNMHLELTHMGIIKWCCHNRQGQAVFSRLQLSISLTVIMLVCVNIDNAHAMTQFYFAIPEVIEDTRGIVFSVNTDNEKFSWKDNGTDIVPDNNTHYAQPDDTGLDLDANEYLLAIHDSLDIGTRVYMCVHIPDYFTEPTCETDAVDKDRIARAAFQFLFN
jgi:hypothetical protein